MWIGRAWSGAGLVTRRPLLLPLVLCCFTRFVVVVVAVLIVALQFLEQSYSFHINCVSRCLYDMFASRCEAPVKSGLFFLKVHDTITGGCDRRTSDLMGSHFHERLREI